MADRVARTRANTERATPSTEGPVPPPVVKHCWYDGPHGRQPALLLRWGKPTPASSWRGYIAVPVLDDAGNWDLVTMWVSAGMLQPLA